MRYVVSLNPHYRCLSDREQLLIGTHTPVSIGFAPVAGSHLFHCPLRLLVSLTHAVSLHRYTSLRFALQWLIKAFGQSTEQRRA